MNKLHIYFRYMSRIFLLLFTFIITGCGSDDPIDLSKEKIFKVSLDVLDSDNWDPSHNNVNNAEMYIFDANGLFIQRIPVEGKDIVAGNSFLITTEETSSINIVVWGNLGHNIFAEDILQNNFHMKDCIVWCNTSLISSSITPGIYHGIKKIDATEGYGHAIEETIELSPKVGSLQFELVTDDFGDSSYKIEAEMFHDQLDHTGEPYGLLHSSTDYFFQNEEGKIVTRAQYISPMDNLIIRLYKDEELVLEIDENPGTNTPFSVIAGAHSHFIIDYNPQ